MMSTVAGMSEPMYFDRDGQPGDLATYMRLHSDPEYRFLRRELAPPRAVARAATETLSTPTSGP